jgi:hypothetical protein
MWSRPAISFAEEFGISGRGLDKICSRFEIPVPPRGYWAKLEVGQHVTRSPLPNTKSDVPSEILIQPSPEGPEAALPEQVRAEVTAVLEVSESTRTGTDFDHPRGNNKGRNTGWRRGGDSNPRSHEGSRDFESRRFSQTPEPLRDRRASMFAPAQSS